MNTQTAPRRNKRKLVAFSITAILLTTLAWYLNNYVSPNQLTDQENRLRAAIAANPLRSLVFGFFIYTVISLIPGLVCYSIPDVLFVVFWPV